MKPSRLVFGLVVLLLMGAALEEWVRKGNAAFERGDYETAVAFYELAEGRIGDPGLAAFNKAAALYQLRDYARASEQYAAALEDAGGVRRVKALYGLGNAQVQLGRDAFGTQALEPLALAVRHYQDCLREEAQLEPKDREICRETFDHARANLQVAEAILAKKRRERPPDASTGQDREPNAGEPGDERTPDGGPGGRKPQRVGRAPGKPVDPGEAADLGGDSHRPGAGNLTTQLTGGVTLDASRALEHLQETMSRLRSDRARALSSVLESCGARDW